MAIFFFKYSDFFYFTALLFSVVKSSKNLAIYGFILDFCKEFRKR